MLKQCLDFYTKNELPVRLALFWISSNVCNTAGSFLASGVLRMRGVAGKAGWRHVRFIFLTSPVPEFLEGGCFS